LSQLIEYNYPIAKLFPDSNFTSSQSQILILNHERKIIALAIEVEQLLVIPELTLQHFNPILPTPKYLLGCTVLEDERLVVVIDVLTLLKNKFYLI
jgi:chemotaxis protein histidine kinase CheA